MKLLIILSLSAITFGARLTSMEIGNPVINKIINQDPARTPDKPKQVDRVRTVNGSTGKYKNKHKMVTGKKFGKSHHKTKTAKPRHGDEPKKQ